MNARASDHKQFALNLRLRDTSSFENFFAARNREAIESVQNAVQDSETSLPTPASWIYLWGDIGCGKTHLLEAACRAVQQARGVPMYIPLKEKAALSPALLDDIEQATLVCVDDVDAIVADADWERALFGLYQRLQAQGGQLLLAAHRSPAGLGMQLPDLATRMAAGLVYQLRPLSDEEKVGALVLRAQQRGMDMGQEVARYLLARFPRDMHSLFTLLDRLDNATLAAQRRLTIPFLRGLE